MNLLTYVDIIALHCPYMRVSFSYNILAFFRGIPDWCIDAYLTHQSHFSLKELINNNLQAFHNSSRCVVAHSADPWVCAVAYDCVTCMELLLQTLLGVVHSLCNIQSQSISVLFSATIAVQMSKYI